MSQPKVSPCRWGVQRMPSCDPTQRLLAGTLSPLSVGSRSRSEKPEETLNYYHAAEETGALKLGCEVCLCTSERAALGRWPPVRSLGCFIHSLGAFNPRVRVCFMSSNQDKEWTVPSTVHVVCFQLMFAPLAPAFLINGKRMTFYLQEWTITGLQW